MITCTLNDWTHSDGEDRRPFALEAISEHKALSWWLQWIDYIHTYSAYTQSIAVVGPANDYLEDTKLTITVYPERKHRDNGQLLPSQASLVKPQL